MNMKFLEDGLNETPGTLGGDFAKAVRLAYEKELCSAFGRVIDWDREAMTEIEGNPAYVPYGREKNG